MWGEGCVHELPHACHPHVDLERTQLSIIPHKKNQLGEDTVGT